MVCLSLRRCDLSGGCIQNLLSPGNCEIMLFETGFR